MVSRRQLLSVLLMTLLCLSSTWGQGRPAPPKLVLVLAIDQMRFDYLTRFAPLYEGGLRLLLDRGAVFTNANYRHSATETGPGHAVILSGAHPRHSGIVANDWYDPYLKRVVNVVDDYVQRPVGGEGRSASPFNALSFTVGDALKRRSPQARVVSVSLKDRSAILMGGRRADGAYWYEAAGGNFITSSYYMSDPPGWLTRWNGLRLADQYAGRPWTRLLPDGRVYEKYAGKDAVEGEWDRKDIVFPHAIRGNPPEPLYYDDLRRTPAADELTLSLALEAMKAHQRAIGVHGRGHPPGHVLSRLRPRGHCAHAGKSARSGFSPRAGLSTVGRDAARCYERGLRPIGQVPFAMDTDHAPRIAERVAL